MDQKLDNVEKNLSDKIDGVEKNLNARIRNMGNMMIGLIWLNNGCDCDSSNDCCSQGKESEGYAIGNIDQLREQIEAQTPSS